MGDIIGNRTLCHVLDFWANDSAQRIMLEDSRDRFSYSSVAACARDLAAQLLSSGLAPGSRVAFIAPLACESVIVQFGLFYAGLTALPINPAFTVEEVKRTVRQFDCACLITSVGTGPGWRSAGMPVVLIELDWKRTRRSASSGSATSDIAVAATADRAAVSADLATGQAAAQPPSTASPAGDRTWLPAPDDLAIIFLTSGTTGTSKGVIYTHGNLLYAAQVAALHYGYAPTDTYLGHFPLFHMNGVVLQVSPMVLVGGRFYPVEKFSASSFHDQLKSSAATVTHLNSTHLRILLASGPRADEADNKLRIVPFGLSATAAEVAEFEARFGVRLVQHFGLTESVGVVMADVLYGEERRLGSLGRPCLGYTVSIVGSDGLSVPAGVTGEITIAAASPHGLMKGYYGDPAGTEQALRGGWLRTGDLGHIDEDGFVWYDGREKDAIKRGGETIAPVEIELTLLGHASVRETAVIGAPDTILGEIVTAYVVVAQDRDFSEEDIIKHCRIHLASFKIPAEFIVVPELPHNAVGKVDKKLLRNRATATRSRPTTEEVFDDGVAGPERVRQSQ